MKRLFGASLTLALAITAPAAAADDFKYSSYYPMQEGATWTYKAGDSKFTLTVKDHRKVGADRWMCAHVETTQDSKVVGSEDVSVQGDGIYRVASDDKPIEPPVLILKLPPQKKPGDVWPVRSSVEPKGGGEKQVLSGQFKGVDGEETTADDVKFPSAVLVSCQDLDAHGAKYSFKTWYVDKIGMVRQEITAGGLTVTLELVREGYKEGSK